MGIIPPELKPRSPFGNIMGNKLVVLKVWFTNHSSKKFTYSFTNPRASNTPLVHSTKNDLVKKLCRLASKNVYETLLFF